MIKDIKNYEGKYAITDGGQVYSYRRNKFMKLDITKNGYVRVGLYDNGKTIHYLIHRLVAEAFLPNPNDLPCVNHKDENRQNNILSNLEWCSYEYNNTYGTRIEKAVKAKSKPVKQLTMDGEFIKLWDSAAEASKAIGAQVYRAANGSRKSAGGYRWEYVKER